MVGLDLRVVRQFVKLELMAIFCVSTASWQWGVGKVGILSMFLGGAVYIIPSFFFARYFCIIKSSRTMQQILMTFYLGEMVKLSLNVGLLLLIVFFIPITILPLVVGFIGAQFGFWLAPLLIKLDRV